MRWFRSISPTPTNSMVLTAKADTLRPWGTSQKSLLVAFWRYSLHLTLKPLGSAQASRWMNTTRTCHRGLTTLRTGGSIRDKPNTFNDLIPVDDFRLAFAYARPHGKCSTHPTSGRINTGEACTCGAHAQDQRCGRTLAD